MINEFLTVRKAFGSAVVIIANPAEYTPRRVRAATMFD